MAGIRRFLLRLVSFFRTGHADAELAREIDSHLHLLEDKFLAQGMSADEARFAARRAFGGVEQAKEHQRDARSFRWLDDTRRDITYALRSLSRSPAFTVAAVLTLSVGIGATTAIYSVVDTILLQPLPFRNSDRLVRVVENFTGVVPGRLFRRGVTHQEFLEWRAHATTLSDAAAVIPLAQRMVRASEGTAGLWGAMTSGNTFSLLGARAMFGRTLLARETRRIRMSLCSASTRGNGTSMPTRASWERPSSSARHNSSHGC